MQHARAALPGEAVGLLSGTDGRIAAAVPLPNIAPPGRFLADPYAQYQAERRFEREGTQLVAIYHSHPGGGTGLSKLDLEFARERRCVHVVIALDPTRPGGEKVAAYAVGADSVRAVSIELC